MDELIKRFESREIRASTARNYLAYIKKISNALTGHDYTNNVFLKDTDKVMDYLKKLTVSVQKNTISALLVAITESKLNPLDGFEKSYSSLNEYLKSLYASTEKPEGEKTVRECKNWLDWNDILKINTIKGKIIKSIGLTSTSKTPILSANFELLQQYLVLSIYTMLAPKRLEYGDMKIIQNDDFIKLTDTEKEKNAYLVIYSKVKKYFAFGKETLKSHRNTDVFEKIDIPKDLNKVLNIWLNYNKSVNLLQNESGAMLGRNGLTRLLLKIFEPYGKSISSQMLRKIYLSEMNKDFFAIQAKEAEICRKMNNSRNTQIKHYIKR